MNRQQAIVQYLQTRSADLRSIHFSIKGATLDEFKKDLKALEKQGLIRSSVQTSLTGGYWLRGPRPNRRTVYSLA